MNNFNLVFHTPVMIKLKKKQKNRITVFIHTQDFMEKAVKSRLSFLKVRAIHKLRKLFRTQFSLSFKEQLPHLGIIGIHQGNAHVLKPSNFQLPRYLMSYLNKITKHIKGTNCIAFNSEMDAKQVLQLAFCWQCKMKMRR